MNKNIVCIERKLIVCFSDKYKFICGLKLIGPGIMLILFALQYRLQYVDMEFVALLRIVKP